MVAAVYVGDCFFYVINCFYTADVVKEFEAIVIFSCVKQVFWNFWFCKNRIAEIIRTQLNPSGKAFFQKMQEFFCDAPVYQNTFDCVAHARPLDFCVFSHTLPPMPPTPLTAGGVTTSAVITLDTATTIYI